MKDYERRSTAHCRDSNGRFVPCPRNTKVKSTRGTMRTLSVFTVFSVLSLAVIGTLFGLSANSANKLNARLENQTEYVRVMEQKVANATAEEKKTITPPKVEEKIEPPTEEVVAESDEEIAETIDKID